MVLRQDVFGAALPQTGQSGKKSIKSVVNVLCSSKNVSIFAADFAAHVLLTVDSHALVKSRV